jgi:hypothetical protein
MESLLIQGLTTEKFFSLLGDVVNIKVEEAVKKALTERLQEKFLSPEETCNLFSPAISLPTLATYSKKGHFKKYSLEGRTWYKYGEVTSALASLKPYSRNALNNQQ